MAARPSSGFARRFIPGAAIAFGAASIVDGFFVPRPSMYPPPGGWYHRKDCPTVPLGTYNLGFGNAGAAYHSFGPKIESCIGGQSPQPDVDDQILGAPKQIPSNHFALALVDVAYITNPPTLTAIRCNYVRWWWRDAGGAGTIPLVVPSIPLNPLPDPNYLRWQPGLQPEMVVPPQAALDLAPSLDPAIQPWQWAQPGSWPRPDLHSRVRTRTRVRERKVLSRAAKVGIWLWGMLDTISETSEIIGAFWDALPAEIREAANCPDRVSFGQYGLDVGACELDALFEHWDKVDAFEAFKNLAKNIVEDMTIGQFHQFLARLYPPGISFQRTAATHALSQADPELYIALRLKELWDFLGV